MAREASSNPDDRRDFIESVHAAISTDKAKVVIVVTDNDEDPEGAMDFSLMFDPPYDHRDEAANPDVFGVAAGFIQYMNKLMADEPGDVAS